MSTFEQVIKILRAHSALGTKRALAKKLGVPPQTLNNWRIRGIPPKWASRIAGIVDNKVTAKQIIDDWHERKLKPK
jgi:DNA-binding transcriptional regulator YdaS (Cro superfamily)